MGSRAATADSKPPQTAHNRLSLFPGRLHRLWPETQSRVHSRLLAFPLKPEVAVEGGGNSLCELTPRPDSENGIGQGGSRCAKMGVCPRAKPLYGSGYNSNMGGGPCGYRLEYRVCCSARFVRTNRPGPSVRILYASTDVCLFQTCQCCESCFKYTRTTDVDEVASRLLPTHRPTSWKLRYTKLYHPPNPPHSGFYERNVKCGTVASNSEFESELTVRRSLNTFYHAS